MTDRPPREDRLEAVIDAMNGSLPASACWTNENGRELVRCGDVVVDVTQMAAHVVDALALLEDQ